MTFQNFTKSSKSLEYYFLHPDNEFDLIYVQGICMYKLTILFIFFYNFLVTHNSRFRQFVFLDSRGITSWSYESVYNTGTPL